MELAILFQAICISLWPQLLWAANRIPNFNENLERTVSRSGRISAVGHRHQAPPQRPRLAHRSDSQIPNVSNSYTDQPERQPTVAEGSSRIPKIGPPPQQRRNYAADPRYSVVIPVRINTEQPKQQPPEPKHKENDDSHYHIDWVEISDIIGSVVNNPRISDKSKTIIEYLKLFYPKKINVHHFDKHIEEHIQNNLFDYEVFSRLPTLQETRDSERLIQLLEPLMSDAYVLTNSSERPNKSICGTEEAKGHYFHHIIKNKRAIGRLCDRLANITSTVEKTFGQTSAADANLEDDPTWLADREILRPTGTVTVSSRWVYENAMIILKYQWQALRFNLQFIVRDPSTEDGRLAINRSIATKTYVPHQFLPAFLQFIRYNSSIKIAEIARASEWVGLIHVDEENPYASYIATHLPKGQRREVWRYVAGLAGIIAFGCLEDPLQCAFDIVSNSIGRLEDDLQLHFQAIPSNLTKLLSQIKTDLINRNPYHSDDFHRKHPNRGTKIYFPHLPQHSSEAVEADAKAHANELFAVVLQIVEEARLAESCLEQCCGDQHVPITFAVEEAVPKKKPKKSKSKAKKTQNSQPSESPQGGSPNRLALRRKKTAPPETPITPINTDIFSEFNNEYVEYVQIKWSDYRDIIKKIMTNPGFVDSAKKFLLISQLIKRFYDHSVPVAHVERHMKYYFMDYTTLGRVSTEAEDKENEFFIHVVNKLVSEFDVYALILQMGRPHESISGAEESIELLFRGITTEPAMIRRLLERLQACAFVAIAPLPLADENAGWTMRPRVVLRTRDPADAIALTSRHEYENASVVLKCQQRAVQFNKQFIQRNDLLEAQRNKIAESIVVNTYVMYQFLPAYLQFVRYVQRSGITNLDYWTKVGLSSDSFEEYSQLIEVKSYVIKHTPSLPTELLQEFWHHVYDVVVLLSFGCCRRDPFQCLLDVAANSIDVLVNALSAHLKAPRDIKRLLGLLAADLRNGQLQHLNEFKERYTKSLEKNLHQFPPLTDEAAKVGARQYAEELYETALQLIEGSRLVVKCLVRTCMDDHKERYVRHVAESEAEAI